MMYATSPNDPPRIKIVSSAHPSAPNFYRDSWQVFVGHAVPPGKDSEWPPTEEYLHGGWKLRFTDHELREAS